MNIKHFLRKIKSKLSIDHIFSRWLIDMGFMNLYEHQVHGDLERLRYDKTVNLVNTLFNTRSGDITIGENSFFGHNCMVLTGRHPYKGGVQLLPRAAHVPVTGYDINIGKGCWIASGSIILGGVTIGDNSIVMAGAVVTKDVPEGTVVGGVPARIISKTEDLI